jgi:hypothetical protein
VPRCGGEEVALHVDDHEGVRWPGLKGHRWIVRRGDIAWQTGTAILSE